MPQIRAFRLSDLERMLAVQHASALAEEGPGPVSREGFEAYWRIGSLRAQRSLWVVEEGGEVLAYGGLRPWHSAEWLQVEVVVDPAQRGQGLGRALLRKLVSASRQRGATDLCAIAADIPGGSGRFLQRYGFRPFVPRQHMRLQPAVPPAAREVPGYRMRPASPADDQALAEINNAAYATGERTGRANAAGYRRFIETSGARVWVAEGVPAGPVVGLCEVREVESALDGTPVLTGHIGSLAVLPAYQGRGLGRQLLSAGVGICRESGLPSVELNVDRDNHTAVHLYESAGFRLVYAFTVYRRSPTERAR